MSVQIENKHRSYLSRSGQLVARQSRAELSPGVIAKGKNPAIVCGVKGTKRVWGGAEGNINPLMVPKKTDESSINIDISTVFFGP